MEGKGVEWDYIQYEIGRLIVVHSFKKNKMKCKHVEI